MSRTRPLIPSADDSPSPRKFLRRDFIKTFAAAAPALRLGRCPRRAPPPGRRPNILWITLEDTSVHFLGCYGDRRARTPHLDRLALEGVRFTRAFSTAPVCAPSRCAIITGCLAEALGTGQMRSAYPIPADIPGFPHYLRQMGYFTTNNLKTDYNLQNEPRFVAQAWDQCFGSGGWGTTFDPRDSVPREDSREAGWWNRPAGSPFFSVFNLFNSHQSRTMTHPYDWYREKIRNTLPPADRVDPLEVELPPFYRDTPEMRRQFARVYDALTCTDREIGRILGRLEADGLKSDTIVFCFADHGEGIPRGKSSSLALGYHVPLIVYVPPTWRHLCPWPMGIACSELVSSSEDAAPTVLSLAGISIPPYMSGRAFLGEQRRPPRPYVWGARNRIDESLDVSRTATDGSYFYIRTFMPQLPVVKYNKYAEVAEITRLIRRDYQERKLNALEASLYVPEQPTECLFDLQSDPWETRNLAGDPQHRGRLLALRGALAEHLLEIRDIHFMPEMDLAARSEQAAPYDFRRDPRVYPAERLLHAAWLVGTGPGAIDEQLSLLGDNDPSVRYWAAVGLEAQGVNLAQRAADLRARSGRDSGAAGCVIAGIAYRLWGDASAREILIAFLEGCNSHGRVLGLQILAGLRGKSAAFLDQLHAMRANLDERDARLGRSADPAEWPYYVERCAVEVLFHFLQGAPLYYPEYRRWMPASELEPDPSISFTEDP